MPGYDRGTKEIVRRFAELGYDAICPNLYWRDAPGAAPDDAAATARAQGGVPDERLIGDVGGAAAYLRALPTSNGKVGVIGYCSGGRQSCSPAAPSTSTRRRLLRRVRDRDAARGISVKRPNLVDSCPTCARPLLGLFGNEDKYPTPRSRSTSSSRS